MNFRGNPNNMPVKGLSRLYWHIFMLGGHLWENARNCGRRQEEYCTMIIENKVGFYELVESPEAVCTEALIRDSKESIWEIMLCTVDNTLGYGKGSFVTFPLRLNADIVDDESEWAIYKTTVNRLYDKEDRRRCIFWGMDADSVFLEKCGRKSCGCRCRSSGARRCDFEGVIIARLKSLFVQVS